VGVIVVKLITETLEGEHSFRGTGLVVINGIPTMMCGSKCFNFGLRGVARYFEHQIKRVPKETPVKGFFVGRYVQGKGIVDMVTQQSILDEDSTEYLPHGLMDTSWQYIVAYPPLKVRVAANVQELNNPEILPDAIGADGFVVAVYEE